MKLEINEIYFLTEVAKQANIKAADAGLIVSLMEKLEKSLTDFKSSTKKNKANCKKHNLKWLPGKKY